MGAHVWLCVGSGGAGSDSQHSEQRDFGAQAQACFSVPGNLRTDLVRINLSVSCVVKAFGQASRGSLAVQSRQTERRCLPRTSFLYNSPLC